MKSHIDALKMNFDEKEAHLKQELAKTAEQVNLKELDIASRTEQIVNMN